MKPTCAVILNREYTGTEHPENVAYCDKPGVHPMKLPSGRLVAWICETHKAVATA